MGNDSTEPSRNHRPFWLGALLVLAVAICFGRLSNAEFLSHWDDPLTVQHNPRFKPPTLAGISRFWPPFLNENDEANLTGRAMLPDARIRVNHAYGLYIPLTYTLWGALAAVANTRDAGLNPWIFHSANIALHAMASLVVFAILRRLAHSDWPALTGAMLFAIHPVQVEAVAWISGMKDVLCGLLSLIAIWQYIAAPKSFRSRRYWLALIAFVAALLSKPSAVTVPVTLIVMDGLILRRTLRQSLLALCPWFVIAAVFAWITTIAQPATGVRPAPLWARPLIAGDSIAFYLRQLICPFSFALDYGRNPSSVMHSWIFRVAWIIPAALLILAFLGRSRSRIPLTSLLIFVLAPLPTLGLTTFLFQTYSTVADHYLYVAMLGPAMTFAWLIAQFHSRAAHFAAAGVIALLAARTIALEDVWHDDQVLFAHVVRVNPTSFLAHNNLGDIYASKGQLDQAEAEFLAAHRANPAYLPTLRNLAHLAELQGRNDDAALWRARIAEVESQLQPELRSGSSRN